MIPSPMARTYRYLRECQAARAFWQVLVMEGAVANPNGGGAHGKVVRYVRFAEHDAAHSRVLSHAVKLSGTDRTVLPRAESVATGRVGQSARSGRRSPRTPSRRRFWVPSRNGRPGRSAAEPVYDSARNSHPRYAATTPLMGLRHGATTEYLFSRASTGRNRRQAGEYMRAVSVGCTNRLIGVAA